MDGLSYAMVAAAAAGIRDCRVDVRVRRIGVGREKRQRAHDHAGVTVTALRRVELDPGGLDRVAPVTRHAFDSRNRLTTGVRRRNTAGTHRLSIDEHGTRATGPYTAAELGSGQPDVITNDPKQRRPRIRIHGMKSLVHAEIERHCLPFVPVRHSAAGKRRDDFAFTEVYLNWRVVAHISGLRCERSSGDLASEHSSRSSEIRCHSKK